MRLWHVGTTIAKRQLESDVANLKDLIEAGGSTMRWIERTIQWLLLALAAITIAYGVGYLARGAEMADIQDYALAVTGMTNDQLAGQSGAAYRLIQDQVRAYGILVVVIGVLFAAIVLYGFRKNERWAWWVLWSLPVYVASEGILHLVDTAPGQRPPGPAITSLIVSALFAAALLVVAPRFFRRSADR
jgi:hypothetical protein